MCVCMNEIDVFSPLQDRYRTISYIYFLKIEIQSSFDEYVSGPGYQG